MRWLRRILGLSSKYSPDGTVVNNLRENRENFITGCGQILGNIHPKGTCAVEYCVIHNPSDHPMRSFRTYWRQAGPFDIKPSHFERICPHGVGHPDPDSLAYLESIGEDGCGSHGCDGCCS